MKSPEVPNLTPEEKLRINEEREIFDETLAKGGAKWVTDGTAKPRLETTERQKQQLKEGWSDSALRVENTEFIKDLLNKWGINNGDKIKIETEFGTDEGVFLGIVGKGGYWHLLVEYHRHGHIEGPYPLDLGALTNSPLPKISKIE